MIAALLSCLGDEAFLELLAVRGAEVAATRRRDESSPCMRPAAAARGASALDTVVRRRSVAPRAREFPITKQFLKVAFACPDGAYLQGSSSGSASKCCQAASTLSGASR